MIKKYGKFFWVITLVPTIWSWYELLTIGFNYSYVSDTISLKKNTVRLLDIFFKN